MTATPPPANTWHEPPSASDRAFFPLCADVRVDAERTFRVYRVDAVDSKTSSSVDIPDAASDSNDEDLPPLFILHHGAGHCAQTWAQMVHCMRGNEKHGREVSVMCYDARGHGSTVTSDDANLSLDTLARDLGDLVRAVYGDRPAYELVLVGHSLGGAVVTEAAVRGYVSGTVLGVVVLDVVEGTALESLAHMDGIVRARPHRFKTTDEAVDWAYVLNAIIQTRQLRSKASAMLSIPPQLKPALDGDGGFVWRTDLLATKPYWEGIHFYSWFRGLSDKFLAIPCARLLVLAGTDRLDRTLTIAQIQGRFQMHIVPHGECGHVVQEDAAGEVGGVLVGFWLRNSARGLPVFVRRKLRKK